LAYPGVPPHNGPIMTTVYSQNHPFWGGGYNTNSLAGGGWGGFPSGYGMQSGYPVNPYQYRNNNYSYYNHNLAPYNYQSGPLLGGFGGFYSPFVGGE